MWNKRGISAIVATVLIILITVAAVAIVWTAIIPMIKTNLELGTVCLEADVLIDGGSGYTCYDSEKKIVAVQVKKGASEVDIPEIEFLLGSEGTSKKITTSFGLNSNIGKTFYIPVSADVEDVSVAPIVKIGNKEKVCDVSSNVKLGGRGCSLSPKVNLNLILPDSLINSDSWTVGTGSVAEYSVNGGASENVREFGIGPYGNSVLLWKAVPDSASGQDGGWNRKNIPIDDTKAYRLTVWIKKTGSNDGSTFFGCRNVNNLNGVANNNPYFWNGDLPELDKWYLLVGYIHGSGDPSMTSYGGIYDGETGEKVISMTDFKNKVGATTQTHRIYLFYDTTITDRQYFWNPTFTEVNDYELPIEI